LKSAAIIAGINQGDQIGRILDYLEVVHFGQFYETYKSSPNILATFFGKSYAHSLAKNVLDYILGDIFQQLIWSPWLHYPRKTRNFSIRR
jgi:hypothetical protein